jgi:hypothetical protein
MSRPLYSIDLESRQLCDQIERLGQRNSLRTARQFADHCEAQLTEAQAASMRVTIRDTKAEAGTWGVKYYKSRDDVRAKATS